MKREEKNRLSKQRIFNSALQEFGTQGYTLGSVNAICTLGDISKGALYHYFKDKDDIFLFAVTECLNHFSQHLSQQAITGHEGYFDARIEFFSRNPLYCRIFFDSVVSPPKHLVEEIKAIRKDFDSLNSSVIDRVLDSLPLRKDVTKDEVKEILEQYQNFLNTQYQNVPKDIDIPQREMRCKRAINILLYGVFERGGHNE